MSTQVEQEQIEEIKNFWTEYGKPILIGLLVAIAVFFAWKTWTTHQQNNKARDVQNYQLLMLAMSQPLDKVNEQDVISMANQLQKDNPDSYYAQYAKFYVAKLAVSQNKLDDAVTGLQAVLNKPADVVIAELARNRLATVLAAQNKVDEALKLLEAPVEKEFMASRQELKGDLYIQKGDIDQAREAYQAALNAAEKDKSIDTLLIKLKLNDLTKEGV